MSHILEKKMTVAPETLVVLIKYPSSPLRSVNAKQGYTESVAVKAGGVGPIFSSLQKG
jgi:hypothetical protein